MALALLFAGLCFRITAVPFHFYAPDVYQGTTHANAALLSVLPKAAGLLVLVRLALVAMPGSEPYGWRIALVLAVATMTLGNVLALWQDNLRRLLAYSSIANAGYMLIGLAVGLASRQRPPVRWDGVAAMFFYLCVYAAATLGRLRRLDLSRPRPTAGRGGRRAGRPGRGRVRWRPPAGRCSCSAWPACRRWPGFGENSASSAALGCPGRGGARSLRPWFVGLAIIGVLNAAVAAVLLPADRRRDVLPRPVGHAEAPGRRRSRRRRLALRRAGLGPVRLPLALDAVGPAGAKPGIPARRERGVNATR